MSSTSVYIAFPSTLMASPNRKLLSLFVTGSHEYLSRLEVQGKTYYGKSVETPVSFENLQAAGANVVSLVSRICPDQKFSENSLVLLTNS